jgi:ligand-binding SRPBCC domain-containing protein
MQQRRFHTELQLPGTAAEIFAFFADAGNLQALTPGWLNFSMLTPSSIELRTGAIIDYRLRIHGFPVRWQTEITAWDPPYRFVDEQRKGPYRLWRHEHRFVAEAGGTRVIDDVLYAPPGGWFIDRLFVRRDIHSIFQYRQQKMLEIFG